ncbi:hypothetical protein CEXT_60271 [Caerostris extrusa]|uniref:Uncharacterized protein n=1 Tax=Caerostris extrusa TaxID=172846 RepID=A0AAV4RLL5_CAEEX|nr:hypothetical protein CEXT_60271 [Caerostris extrusa]
MIRFKNLFPRHNGVWQHTSAARATVVKRVFSGVDLPAENNPRNDGIRTQRNKGRNLHSLRSRIVYVRSVSVNCVIWRTTPTVERRRIVPEREDYKADSLLMVVLWKTPFQYVNVVSIRLMQSEAFSELCIWVLNHRLSENSQ